MWRHQGSFFNTTDLTKCRAAPDATSSSAHLDGRGGCYGTEASRRAGRRLDLRHAVSEAQASMWKSPRRQEAQVGERGRCRRQHALTIMRARRGRWRHAKKAQHLLGQEIEIDELLGSADACIDRLGSLFARGIETVILRLVKLDLAQLDVLAAKILPLL